MEMSPLRRISVPSTTTGLPHMTDDGECAFSRPCKKVTDSNGKKWPRREKSVTFVPSMLTEEKATGRLRIRHANHFLTIYCDGRTKTQLVRYCRL